MAEDGKKKIEGTYIGSDGLVEGQGQPPYFEHLANPQPSYGGVDGFQEGLPPKRRNDFREVLDKWRR